MQNEKKNNGIGFIKMSLIVLAGIIVLFLALSFGWIAGVIWLLFFRKKLQKEPKKQKIMTIIISALSVFSFGFLIYSSFSTVSLDSIEIYSDTFSKELSVDQDYVINIEYSPANAELSDFAYNIDGSGATFEKSTSDKNKAILHTESEGTVVISVSNGEVQSNSLTFDIKDDSEETEEPSTEQNSDAEDMTETPTELSEESEPEDSEEPPQTINDVDINFSKTVLNDTTGNWRLTRVATTKEIQEYALDYYNSYFQSDDEVHAIVNFTLNTTNRLVKVTSDILDVTVYDYVSKEEHDAKALFSGTLLANYEINVSTGEINQIPLESEEQNETASENPADADQTDDTAAAQSAVPDSAMVWLSATGSKYHSIPDCGKMNPSTARQISEADAIASGYSACSKCH